MKMAVHFSSPFFFLFKKGKTLKVMEYPSMITMETKKFPWLAQICDSLSFLRSVTRFCSLPECKSLLSCCDYITSQLL